MIWKITIKDIKSFCQTERKVFLWLIFCMICGSFVLNYSYSFARYRGEIYENNSGISVSRYQILGHSTSNDFCNLMKEISNSVFPEVSDYQLFTTSSEGYSVVGSSFISKKSAYFTGLWIEGYANNIDSGEHNACAVSDRLLDYDNRLKMTGENFYIDNDEFIIRGVYEMSINSDVVIFSEKFLEKYDDLDKYWITFSHSLNNEQEQELFRLIKVKNPDCTIIVPPTKGSISSDIIKSNELQYTAIIVMLIVCIVSILKYWQEVNISTYTIYWINGATHQKIIILALCESVVLCVSTYLIGLGLNALSRFFISKNSPLELFDVLMGFGVFFGVFAVFTLINTVKICKSFTVKNVRRD